MGFDVKVHIMLFNSFEFLIYLPVVFLLYWLVFKHLKIQNLFLVIVSYIFYGWWETSFLYLIAFTTLCSFFSGILTEKLNNIKAGRGKIVLYANILINLFILCVFKYYNFFIDSFIALLHSVGCNVECTWTLNLVLPVGISFYTFQALSYSIDVYQKKMPACKDIVAFFAYISFFPQLVAGPIERGVNLLPQFYVPRNFNYAKAVDGCRQILWGFFKKMVVADNCALIVNDIWNDYANQDGITLLWGAILFAFQIYGDFSGYSDIAIGTARLFGINLMRNFSFPYFSRDIAEFWRRWHISLTTWFRDYVYIPLGGSRCAKWKVMRNTMIIFLVSGLWHGANWTFVIWGLYHALLFFPLMLFGQNRKHTNIVANRNLLPSIKEFIQMAITFFLVVIGWIIFRAENITQAWDYIFRMVTEFHIASVPYGRKVLLYISVLLIVEWLQRDKQHGLQITERGIWKYRLVRFSLYYVLVFAILALKGESETFIYFQF